jgi:hypothetical protein
MGFFDKVVNFFKAGTPDDSTAAKGRGFKHQKAVAGPRVEAVVMPGGFAGGGVQVLPLLRSPLRRHGVASLAPQPLSWRTRRVHVGFERLSGVSRRADRLRRRGGVSPFRTVHLTLRSALGAQGLWWYVKRLFTDDDGYVATQFLQETWTPAAADGGSLCPPTLSVFREGPLAVDHREVPTALSDLIWRKLTVVTGDVLPLRD